MWFDFRLFTKGWGFKDVVRSPRLWKSLLIAKDQEKAWEQNLRTTGAGLSPPEIDELVEQLFRPIFDADVSDLLEGAAQRALPALIDALNDPRAWNLKYTSAGRFGPDAPFQWIAIRLAELDACGVIPRFIEFLEHPDRRLREYAAFSIGRLASMECLEAFTNVLRKFEDSVQSNALSGLNDAINAKQIDPGFVEAVFPDIANLLDSKYCDRAGTILLTLDRARARSEMLSEKVLSLGNRSLHEVLEHLFKCNCTLPRERREQFLVEAKLRSSTYPFDYIYAVLLKHYGRDPDIETEKLLWQALEHPEDCVQRGAGEGLAIFYGMEDFHRICVDHETDVTTLTDEQRYYREVRCYDSEVLNGGHEQYFFNTDGDEWKWALKGLEAINAPERAEILGKVVAQFGKKGLSGDEATRSRQIARLSETAEQLLEESDGRYYDSKESITRLLYRFVMTRRDKFS